ncbi:hypothetical protein H257_12846 [Aphanomyces astaci]|uniref:Uncharacterized protein n=1 Tax=Aphanomyces astaci TaxID=112090 RepID=W4FZ60_APHAT|nr:hypothetical protein H257_12846 [Aphanomyces astaci]ETV72049.1 hypothetical protein H257_12846 [Aphanomyces astaci]|eukprot:XP_009838492.1 hypothetical protein H257_12846 [Aphanomyces astaci]
MRAYREGGHDGAVASGRPLSPGQRSRRDKYSSLQRHFDLVHRALLCDCHVTVPSNVDFLGHKHLQRRQPQQPPRHLNICDIVLAPDESTAEDERVGRQHRIHPRHPEHHIVGVGRPADCDWRAHAIQYVTRVHDVVELDGGGPAKLARVGHFEERFAKRISTREFACAAQVKVERDARFEPRAADGKLKAAVASNGRVADRVRRSVGRSPGLWHGLLAG